MKSHLKQLTNRQAPSQSTQASLPVIVWSDYRLTPLVPQCLLPTPGLLLRQGTGSAGNDGYNVILVRDRHLAGRIAGTVPMDGI